MTEHTLAEFKAWCEGKGRGPNPGRHWSSLQAIKRFEKFEQEQSLKREMLEKKAKMSSV